MKIFKKFEKTMECYKIGKNTYLILEIYIGIKKKIKLNIIRKMHIIWTLKNLLVKKNRMSNFHNENSFFLTNYPNFVINNIIFPKIYKYIRLRKVCVPLSENSRIQRSCISYYYFGQWKFCIKGKQVLY